MAREGPLVTIRDRIKAIQVKLRDVKLTPALAREAVMSLTALGGNVADEERDAELAYKRVLNEAMEKHEKANRARIEAETSEEYARYRQARDTAHLVDQLVISCRGYLRSLDTEMRMGAA
jgi:hypothetical protein